MMNDQVSIGHPYSGLTIPVMSEAAGLYHTNPRLVYLPQQPALGKYNSEYGNTLYMLELRPDENWEGAVNFGNAKNIIGTDKMLEKVMDDNENRIDQLSYVRARLFDMFLGDWSRHEDQWRWAEINDGKETMYRSIPRDRDQIYTKFDGILLYIGLPAAGFGHLQSFGKTIHDVPAYNFTARNLDRFAANEPSREQWINIAKLLQHVLTDHVIETAIKNLPPETFSISGNKIIQKLKSRRSHLIEFANEYYKFLANEVEITGSNDRELFDINRINDTATFIKVFRISNTGEVITEPFYSRMFFKKETKEVRLYGLDNDDIFIIKGPGRNGVPIRIIGGGGIDSLNDQSIAQKKLLKVYDTEKSRLHPSSKTEMNIKNDTAINAYKYDAFEYQKKGFKVLPGLLYIKAGYSFRKREWRKQPFGSEHSIITKYYITRGALNIEYKGLLNEAIGKWNIEMIAGANLPRVVNFFGIGNETILTTKIRRYNRLRSDEFYGKFGINRSFGLYHFIEIAGFYQTVKIRNDNDRIIGSFVDHSIPDYLSRKHFAGSVLLYKYLYTDDVIVPTKGIAFNSSAAYTFNLSDMDRSFTRLASDAAIYIPLLKFISIGIRVGGATNIGDAEFYQLNRLGSDENLRGYRKQRFYGKTSFFNNNELRFSWDTRNKIFNGKIGVFTFYDNGRVWQPGENSDTWHAGYGGGIFIAPFHKILFSAAYGISKEDKVLSGYVGFYF